MKNGIVKNNLQISIQWIIVYNLFYFHNKLLPLEPFRRLYSFLNLCNEHNRIEIDNHGDGIFYDIETERMFYCKVNFFLIIG